MRGAGQEMSTGGPSSEGEREGEESRVSKGSAGCGAGDGAPGAELVGPVSTHHSITSPPPRPMICSSNCRVREAQEDTHLRLQDALDLVEERHEGEGVEALDLGAGPERGVLGVGAQEADVDGRGAAAGYGGIEMDVRSEKKPGW